MADPQTSLEGDTGGDDATAPHTLLEIPPPKKKDKSGGKEGDQMGLFFPGGGSAETRVPRPRPSSVVGDGKDMCGIKHMERRTDGQKYF